MPTSVAKKSTDLIAKSKKIGPNEKEVENEQSQLVEQTAVSDVDEESSSNESESESEDYLSEEQEIEDEGILVVKNTKRIVLFISILTLIRYRN